MSPMDGDVNARLVPTAGEMCSTVDGHLPTHTLSARSAPDPQLSHVSETHAERAVATRSPRRGAGFVVLCDHGPWPNRASSASPSS